MVSLILLVLAGVALASAGHITPYQEFLSRQAENDHDPTFGEHLEKFHNFVMEYGKNYDTLQEVYYRFSVFSSTLKRIAKLNANSKTATFGINKFSDLSPDEFISIYGGLRVSVQDEICKSMTEIPKVEVPTSLDYNKQNMVSVVKSQGQCGSCWAFSTTGSIEGQYAKKTGKLVSVSEQQLVDCVAGTSCLEGGNMLDGFTDVIQRGGIESEESYPYTSGGGQEGQCSFDKSKVVVKLSGCENWDVQGNEDSVKKILTSRGPLSIALAGEPFQDYHGGILTDDVCSSDHRLSHGVLLTGFGTENGTAYWIVKNSWGAEWGENGFIRLKYGVNCLGFLNVLMSNAIIA